MKSTEILNKIKTFLIEDKVEETKEETQLEVQEEIKEEVKVELAQAKLENGTVVESESFKAGDEIFIVTDDEKVAMPVGEYVMEDGKLLVVEEEGLIADYKEVSDGNLPFTANIITNSTENGYYTVSKTMEDYANQINY